MAAFLVAATLAARPNLCFTAHGKSTLQCTMPLVDGPISVYDDSESPQKARKMFFSGGKLCKERGCKKCMAPGGAWVSCGSKEAKGLTVAVMGANGDAAKPKAIAFAVLLTIIPCAVFYLVGKQRASKPIASGKGSGPAPTGIASSAVEFLLRFAGAPWFPLIAALGTAINMFTSAQPPVPVPRPARQRACLLSSPLTCAHACFSCSHLHRRDCRHLPRLRPRRAQAVAHRIDL